jgi:proteasome accessory factor C
VDRTHAKLEAAAGDGAALAAQVDVRVSSHEAEVTRLRSTLAHAVEEGRQVRLGYYVPARDEATERTVDPLRLVSAEGNTYLQAWCHLAEDQRLFRLDRVSSAEVLDTAVDDHSDMQPRDLAAGLFQPSPDDVLVTLRLDPETRWVAEYYPVESTEELPGGGLRVTLRAGDTEWLTRLMLRIGDAAEVEEPAELSAVVRRAAAQGLHNYE